MYKGFGFIKPSDGSDDVFCHRMALLDSSSFDDGEPVSYQLGENVDGRLCAKQVQTGKLSGTVKKWNTLKVTTNMCTDMGACIHMSEVH